MKSIKIQRFSWAVFPPIQNEDRDVQSSMCYQYYLALHAYSWLVFIASRLTLPYLPFALVFALFSAVSPTLIFSTFLVYTFELNYLHTNHVLVA